MTFLFVLDPCFGAWPTGLLLAFIAAALGWEALHRAPLRRLPWRLGLRLALVALLAALLLRPTDINAEQQELTPTLALLLDSSRSLQLPGLDGPGTPPRADAGRQLLRDRLIPAFIAAPGKHESWALNDTLRWLETPPEKIDAWPAGGGGSNLAAGLDALLNGSAPGRPGARCDAVVFLTDGAVTRGPGWQDWLARAAPLPAPVYVFALGNPDRPAATAFDLGRIAGPDRVKAGESARYTLTLVAPADFTLPAAADGTPAPPLKFHWRLDGQDLAIHDLPVPQHGATATDTITVPCPEPGLLRLSCSVEPPPNLPPIEPAETTRLIQVDAARIRVLFWSMQLSRETRRLEEHLARDRVLSVNVANDFTPGQPADVANALRSADVLVWETPDLTRLPPATLQLVEARLRAGMGLVLLSSPRLDLTRAGNLLTWVPAQAAAPWVLSTTQPIAPAELRAGGFWRGTTPSLPKLDGRLQQFAEARNTAGFEPVISTAEGRPILLAGKPLAQTAVAVLLTPDWPAAAPATEASLGAIHDYGAQWTLGPLIRHTVHWAAGIDDQAGRPRLILTLTDDRPLPDEPLEGGIELQHLDSPVLDAAHLQLQLTVLPTAATAGTHLPPPQLIRCQAANGVARYHLKLSDPGSYLLTARYQQGETVLTDRVPVFVAGDELERETAPAHADLRELAARSGGLFFPPGPVADADLARLQADLQQRLTPRPLVQVARAPFGGMVALGSLLMAVLLVEMFLRTRRLW